MTPDELKSKFPRASAAFLRLNAAAVGGMGSGTDSQPDDTGTPAKLERDPRDGALGQRQIQDLHSGKVLVRITSFRSRLLDEDNQCVKYHVDCCRYAGLIRQDDPRAAKIETRQEKVGAKEPEFVRIEIFRQRKGAVLV